MKKGSLSFLALMMLGAIMLSACSGGEPTEETTGTEETVVTEETTEETGEVSGEWTEKPEVAFSTLSAGIMDSKYYASTNPTGYKEFWLKGGTGACVEQGLAPEIGYVQDEELGYSVVVSGDGSYRENVASLDFVGNIGFGGVELTSGTARCVAATVVGNDSATVTCEVPSEDESVVASCESTYTVTASK